MAKNAGRGRSVSTTRGVFCCCSAAKTAPAHACTRSAAPRPEVGGSPESPRRRGYRRGALAAGAPTALHWYCAATSPTTQTPPGASQFTIRMTPGGPLAATRPTAGPHRSRCWAHRRHGCQGPSAVRVVGRARPIGQMESPRRRMAQAVRPRSSRQETAFGNSRRAACGEPTGRYAGHMGSQRSGKGGGQLWARFIPAGQGWSKPVKVTRASSPPGSSSVALGEGGHAAIAWMPAQRARSPLSCGPRRRIGVCG